MENKGAKVAVVIFTILAVVAFSLGTVIAMPMLQTGTAETAEQQAGEILAVVILVAPFLISYLLFALFDLISFFISIHLIRNGSKGMGVFHLFLTLILLGVAVFISLKLFVF